LQAFPDAEINDRLGEGARVGKCGYLDMLVLYENVTP
jgi:hypothetical protein